MLGPDGMLYVGGNFTSAGGVSGTNCIARWDPATSTWSSVGGGTDDGFVHTLVFGPDGALYAGGSFTSVGGISAGGLARWDGSSWTSLSSGMTSSGTPSVRALAFAPDGTLYVGGSFTGINGLSTTGIAKVNLTTGVWSKLGTGTSGGSVDSIAINKNGIVYAVGTFGTMGGVANTGRIARWNGSAWSSIGSANANVWAATIAPDGLTLYVGGEFRDLPGTTPRWGISRYPGSGTTWYSLGDGIGSATGTSIYALSFGPDGMLYAGGSFSKVRQLEGPDVANTARIARWNPSTSRWSSITSATPGGGNVYQLAHGPNGVLYIGGSFTSVGGDTAVAQVAQTGPIASTSTLSVSPTTTAADGIASATFTIQAKEFNGANWTAGGAQVAIAKVSGPGSLSGVTDNGDGTYTATVSSASAGPAEFVATLNGAPVQGGSGSQTVVGVTFSALSQSITFGALGGKVFGAAPFDVSASASSGLPVSFVSTTTGVCTVSGSTVTIVGAGSCSITASQAGDAQWAAAADVTQVFTVTQAPQSITFGALPDRAFGDGPFVLSATASSGLPVSFASTTTSVCTVAGSVVTIVSAGSCSITASQAGTANVSAATSVTRGFTVNTKAQSITFDPLPDTTFGAAPFVLDASASSGLPVSFTSTTTSVCTVAGSTVTIVSAGSCSITASQAGNANVAAAADVTQAFTVAKATQVPLAITSASSGREGATIALTSSGGSGSGAVTWAVVSPTGAGLCSLSGSTLTLGATGSLCQVQATRAGDDGYLPASSPVQTVTITAPVPTLTAVSPVRGPATGGTSITLTGTGFIAGDTAVEVDGAPCLSLTVTTATSLTCLTPARSAGVVAIEVTTSGGSATLPSAFTYRAAPTITSIAPAYGPVTGGTTFTITGTGFVEPLTGGTTVTVDGTTCANATYLSPTQVTCETVAHAAGAVDVAVTTDGGIATRSGGFTFVDPPTLTGFSPVVGPDNGGTTLTVTGTGFVAGQTTVTVGGNVCASVMVAGDGASLTCRTPAGSIGQASIEVTTPGGSVTATGTFEYVAAPTITAITPAYGAAATGESITVTGTGFVVGSTAVTVGESACASVAVTDSQTLTCIAPAVAPNKAGSVDVVVTTPVGSGTKVNGFAYVAAPTVTGITPAAGPTTGNTAITITGTGFIAAQIGAVVTDVTVTDATSTTAVCASVVVVSATRITCTTPAGTAGAASVDVTTYGGTASGTFTYMDAPTVGTVAPVVGPATGGTTITITGSGFVAGVTTVTVGGQVCTSPTVAVGGASLTCTTTARVAGVVDVVVTAPGGSVMKPAAFEYVGAPTVSAVAPLQGPTDGGTDVTITGTGFTDAGGTSVVTAVSVGGVTCPVVGTPTATELTCTTGAHAAGAVPVAVTTIGGTATRPSSFTYLAAPTITTVTPATGPLAGGTSITITGTGFVGVSAVKIGTASCASFTINSATSITCTTPGPALAGSVAVAVTTPGGTADKPGGFTYLPAPTISTLAPAAGSTAGGTQITVTGTGFVPGATTVSVGGGTCASPSVAGDGLSLTCTTPAHAAGGVDVVVSTAGGSATESSGFTYVAAPTVSAVAPASGPMAGATTVTVTGTSFVNVTAVRVGGVDCASFSVTDATTLTCVTPGGSAGSVAVAVTAAGGTATRANAFTYLALPTVSTVAPAAGPVTGGTTITVTGTGFTPGATVAIDGDVCTVLSVAGDGTSLTCVTSAPSGSGSGDIVVTTPGGTVTKSGGFTFVAAPTLTAVSPAAGPTAGGTTITVAGSGFVAGSTTVSVGGSACASVVVAIGGGSLTCATTSGSAGAAHVVVTTPGGDAALVNGFTYMPAPTVSTIIPATGPAAGGTSITVTGSGFVAGATTVTVGGAPCTSVAVAGGGGSLSCFTPAGAVGSANVVVTTDGGAATKTGGFTFVGAPTISAVTPSQGPTAGGTSITITGTGFVVGATDVTVGGTSCGTVVVASSTSLTCATPGPVSAGPVAVTVTTAGGSDTRLSAFTYLATPSITAVAPAQGSTAGGTRVTITGSGYVTGGTSVTVGGNACTSAVVASASVLACTTTAHAAGAVDVVVQTAGGTSTLPGGYEFLAAPSAPGTPSAVAGAEKAEVTWPPATGDVTYYTVESVPAGASCTVAAPATTCTVAPLVAGVGYDFVVTAHGPGGSAASAVSTSPVVPYPVLPAVDWNPAPAANDNAWTAVAYGNATFVAVSGNGSGDQVMVSTDGGLTWDEQTTPLPAAAWNAIAFGSLSGGGPQFVAVGDDGAVMTSPDGLAWTGQTPVPTPTHDWQSVAYGDGVFVAVADDGAVMRSTDGGLTWAPDAAPTSAVHPWAAVTYGDGRFVAVADDGAVMTSTDGGLTWTEVAAPTPPTAHDWSSVTYGEGVFVAVGDGGAVMTSPDGLTWTPRSLDPPASGNDWTSVTYGGGVFVAVADTGTGDRVMTSEDGITWVPRDSTADADWSSVVFGGGTFVAVASDGAGGAVDQVMVSPDGVRVPGTPGTPTATAGVGSAVVSWDPPVGGGQVTGYTVLSVPTGGSCTVSAPATSCTVSPLQPGEDYTFVVTAHGPGGDTSSAISTTPVTPVAPGGGGGGGSVDVPTVDPTPVTPVTPAPTEPVIGPLDPVTAARNPHMPTAGIATGGSLLLVGTSSGTGSGATPMQLLVHPNRNRSALIAETTADTFWIELAGRGATGATLGLTKAPANAIILQSEPLAGRTARMLPAAPAKRVQPVAESSGRGLQPGSEVRFWLLDETYLGALTVRADGTYAGRVPVPAGLAAGGYTLQVNAFAADGQVRSLSLGVVVQVAPRPTAVTTAKARSRVFFPAMSAQLTRAAKATLNRLVRRTGKAGISTVIIGWVQPSASTVNDASLSRARAKAVASHLRGRGLTGTFTTKGQGVKKASTTSAKARRVDITITYRQPQR